MKENPKRRYYLDANFLTAYFINNHEDHDKSKKLMFTLLKEKAELFISSLTLDETWYKVYETLQRQIPKDQRKPFKEFYINLKAILKSILEFPNTKIIQFENDLIGGVKNALENIRNYNLRPRDAFHYAIMKDCDITLIVTKDKDFRGIPHIKTISF